MPTYQYKCETCKQTVSQVVAVSEERKTPECLDCKKEMIRVFSAPSLTFKGSGWGSDR
jgi:putative FmdB family regulatory protein